MAEKPEIEPLTGLRGIAAMLVVVAHYQSWVAPWNSQTVPTNIVWILWTSDYGMTLFFTLSGFVITYNYLSLDWHGRPLGSFAAFMWKRLTRLYPALLIFIVWAGLTNGLSRLAPNHPVAWTLLHILSVETWIPAFANDALPMNSVYNVSWSISTEIGMYLMFALVLVLAMRLGRGAALAAIACFGIAIIVLAVLFSGDAIAPNRLAILDPATPRVWSRWFFYQSPYFRILQFTAGALAAWTFLRFGSMRGGRSLATASVVALAALYITRNCAASPIRLLWLGHWYDVLTAVLFALIMFNGADQRSMLNRVLSSRPLVVIGTVSYSLYLFHPFIPRMNLFGIGDQSPFDWSRFPQFIVNMTAMIFFAIAFAYGMYYLWEVPTRRTLRQLGDRFVAARRTAPQQAAVSAPAA